MKKHARLASRWLKKHALTDAQVLGEVDGGFEVMNEWLYATRITVATMSVGRARRCFEYALHHAAERHAATDLALQELKRLEVAKALATEPKMLLLDEVLAGLETSGKRLFMTKLRELHQQYSSRRDSSRRDSARRSSKKAESSSSGPTDETCAAPPLREPAARRSDDLS